jgi:uncharacterized protein YegP (UPF0339 family)
MMLKIHLLRNTRTKQYRWRAVSPNGKSIAIGGETYKTRAGTLKGLGAFVSAVANSDYEIVEPKAGRAK